MERERQARIAAGLEAVNEQFAGFDDSYFKRIEKDALDYYTPQLDDQFRKTRRNLVLDLDRRGNLNSSAGIRRLRELDEARNENAAQIGNRALDLANRQRGQIEGARSDILNQVYAGADPAGAGSLAAQRVASLEATPAFGPIGDLFSNFANFTANGIRAEQAGFRGFGTGLFGPNSRSAGSAKVVT